MGRGATKASGNVWYQARMEAAKWNDRLSSRAGAAEVMNMSEDVVKDTELGLWWTMIAFTFFLFGDRADRSTVSLEAILALLFTIRLWKEDDNG